jgi:LCP family protein required for cell wall assembly
VLVIGLVVVLMGVAAAATAAARMSRINVKGLSDAGDRMNVLVVGSDSRAQLNEQQRRRLGTGSAEGLRTDTILLLQIQGDSAAMLSFPRDLFVTRCDGSQGRINVAYALGGPSCLVDTVTELSGIPVSHYLEIDFLGFASIVNAVGGVSVFLDEPLSDRDAHIDLPAGCVTLNGRQALGFVRVRKVDNDLGRIARQQRFIKELAKQAAQPSTLLNPLRLFRTANAAGAALTADRGLGPVDLAKLARAGRGLGGSGLPSFAVPGTDSIIGGAAVIVPNEAQAERIFRSFRNGSVLERRRGALRPSQAEVMVRNGEHEDGSAGRDGRSAATGPLVRHDMELIAETQFNGAGPPPSRCG